MVKVFCFTDLPAQSVESPCHDSRLDVNVGTVTAGDVRKVCILMLHRIGDRILDGEG